MTTVVPVTSIAGDRWSRWGWFRRGVRRLAPWSVWRWARRVWATPVGAGSAAGVGLGLDTGASVTAVGVRPGSGVAVGAARRIGPLWTSCRPAFACERARVMGTRCASRGRVRERVEPRVVLGQAPAVVFGYVPGALGAGLGIAGHGAQHVHALAHDLLVGGAGAGHGHGVPGPCRRFDLAQALFGGIQVEVRLLFIGSESDSQAPPA